MQEVWKLCPGYEATHEVSNLGRVRSLDRVVNTSRGTRVSKGRVLKLNYTHPSGYARARFAVDGTTTNKTIHPLIARAFLGDPPGPTGSRRGEWTVDHLDFDKTNNRVDNLEWVTSEENFRRYVDRGTVKRGAAHPSAKLTDDDVREIRRLYATGQFTQRELAEQYDVSPSRVSTIIRREGWSHVA